MTARAAWLRRGVDHRPVTSRRVLCVQHGSQHNVEKDYSMLDLNEIGTQSLQNGTKRENNVAWYEEENGVNLQPRQLLDVTAAGVWREKCIFFVKAIHHKCPCARQCVAFACDASWVARRSCAVGSMTYHQGGGVRSIPYLCAIFLLWGSVSGNSLKPQWCQSEALPATCTSYCELQGTLHTKDKCR